MVVKGKTIVQFFSGVKALCPLPHLLDEVGAELVFRVLGCKSKRITVTHKKTLNLKDCFMPQQELLMHQLIY
ncbi:hypothetical protein FRX31_015597 [Thalictrum thalictroides]|uniref:Uncharacterized protein n=1 Tax=Thalictrum thalictroides TaxID=46969 RepID=A0A7J6WD44_THATH|nr:hypothetical protein FRX31_015597 [Thalictrum thalictroides]